MKPTHLVLNAQMTAWLRDEWAYDRVNLFTVRARHCFDFRFERFCWGSLNNLLEISCFFVSVKHKAFRRGLGFVPLAIPTPSSNVLRRPFLITSLQCKAEGLTEVVSGTPSGTITRQVPRNTKWSMIFTFTVYCIRKGRAMGVKGVKGERKWAVGCQLYFEQVRLSQFCHGKLQ